MNTPPPICYLAWAMRIPNELLLRSVHTFEASIF